jgi:Na+/melibiose symporter-like transporter
MFACIAGSTKLQGNMTALTTIPSVIVTFLSISLVATRLGQRKAMIVGSWGGIIMNILMFCLWKTLSMMHCVVQRPMGSIGHRPAIMLHQEVL